MKCDAFRLLQQQGHTRESDPERLPLSSEQSSRVGALPWRLYSFRGKTLHPLCLLSLSLSQSKISVTREQQCAEREEIDGVPPAAQKQTQAFLALGCSAWLISGHVSTDAVWIYVTKSQCVRLAACACLRKALFSPVTFYYRPLFLVWQMNCFVSFLVLLFCTDGAWRPGCSSSLWPQPWPSGQLSHSVTTLNK